MASNQFDWNLYRSFLAVMREGSLSGAARSLGLTQPSIGRHIDALEGVLGVALFTRAPDGLRPTSMARELLPYADAMASTAQLAARVATGEEQEERGTVRVTASQIIGGEVLPWILAQFFDQHPNISVELVLNNENDDVLKREADIAVRMVRPTQQSLVAKRLGRVDVGMFAHQRYVKAKGLPRSLLELRNHVLIGPDQDLATKKLMEQRGLAFSSEMFTLRTDNDLAQLAALRAGLGIGGCQWGLARRDSNLIAVLPKDLYFNMDMWLVTHAGLRKNQRVMALYKYLGVELIRYAKSSLCD